jgi:hypothetical protein
MRTIRASEIGSFLYCQRAWWYQTQGIESINQGEMAAGEEFHQQHSISVLSTRLLRLAGWVLLLVAVVLLSIALTLNWMN